MAPYVKAVYLLTNNQTNILSRFMCTANMKIRNDSVVAAPCQRCKRSASFNLPGRQARCLLLLRSFRLHGAREKSFWHETLIHDSPDFGRSKSLV